MATRGRLGVLGRANQGAGALPAAEQVWYMLHLAHNAPTLAGREQLRVCGEKPRGQNQTCLKLASLLLWKITHQGARARRALTL